MNIEEIRLVSASLTTSAWQSQYPESVDFFVPRRDELLLEDESLCDTSLALPVTASTKRGRPATERKHHAMEAAITWIVGRNGGR